MSEPAQGLQPERYLAPRFWPTWLALGLLRLLVLLPFPLLLRLGALLGDLLYLALPARRRIAATNLRLCFPELDDARRRSLLRSNFRATGMSLFETGLSWWAAPQRLQQLYRIEGLEHVQHALERGKGVILLSAHLTCLEIGGRLLSLQQPFQVMYKKQRNPLFEAVMKQARVTHYQRAIQRHDVRGMIRSLKENVACWYAPDQDFGRKNALFVPFFGVPAATVTATSRFARLSGAAVVPFFPLRRADGSGYDLTLLAPLEGFGEGDDYRDTERLNTLIETQVRKAPEQYLWLHRRFGTRPEGEPELYS